FIAACGFGCDDAEECVEDILGRPLTGAEKAGLKDTSGCTTPLPPGPPIIPPPTEEGPEATCPTDSTEDPVKLAYGHKIESVTDVTVRVTSSDFSITRQYTSQPDIITDTSYVGSGWTMDVFQYLYAVDAITYETVGGSA